MTWKRFPHYWQRVELTVLADAWHSCDVTHEEVIKWRHFPRYWPFVRGIHRGPVNSPHKWPVTRSFGVFFDLRLNKRLNKQSWGWWFETPSRSLWRHRNGNSNGSERLSQILAMVYPWSLVLLHWYFQRQWRKLRKRPMTTRAQWVKKRNSRKIFPYRFW